LHRSALPGAQAVAAAATRAAQVNSLSSFETELPYEYYTMPFCQPPEGIRKMSTSANLGTILMGLRIENSPYNFTMQVGGWWSAGWAAQGRGARPPWQAAARADASARALHTAEAGAGQAGVRQVALRQERVHRSHQGRGGGERCAALRARPGARPPQGGGAGGRRRAAPAALQNIKHKIDNRYRINMVLDNLPVTVYDLMDEVRRGGGTPPGRASAPPAAQPGGIAARPCLPPPLPLWPAQLALDQAAACSSKRAPRAHGAGTRAPLPPLPPTPPSCRPPAPSPRPPAPGPPAPAPQDQEFVRPGFELGYTDGSGRYFINNHLVFNILVHTTHGEYTRARQAYKDAITDALDTRRRCWQAGGGGVWRARRSALPPRADLLGRLEPRAPVAQGGGGGGGAEGAGGRR
jgi:hypothetical protein